MKTKQLFSLLILSLFVISAVSCVSAKTLVAGKIYNADYTATVSGAFVNVTCNGNSVITNSSSNGDYAVDYTETECDVGDFLEVYASHSDYGEGTNNWEGITDKTDLEFFDMNLGIANVPLVPEFGVFVGALTILSALTVFFVIRRQ